MQTSWEHHGPRLPCSYLGKGGLRRAGESGTEEGNGSWALSWGTTTT